MSASGSASLDESAAQGPTDGGDSGAARQEAQAQGLTSFPAVHGQAALRTSSSSSRSFKPDLRVSFAEQLQTSLEFEAQHAQHGAATSSGRYFQDNGYFSEAASAEVYQADARLEEPHPSLNVSAETTGDVAEAGQAEEEAKQAEEEETLHDVDGGGKEGEEAGIQTAASEAVCDAGEPWPKSDYTSAT